MYSVLHAWYVRSQSVGSFYSRSLSSSRICRSGQHFRPEATLLCWELKHRWEPKKQHNLLLMALSSSLMILAPSWQLQHNKKRLAWQFSLTGNFEWALCMENGGLEPKQIWSSLLFAYSSILTFPSALFWFCLHLETAGHVRQTLGTARQRVVNIGGDECAGGGTCFPHLLVAVQA